MFANLNDFTDFKIICQKENIEYHTYMVSTEKTTVIFKGFTRLSEARICNICTEIPTHTKYPIYRVIFAFKTSLAQINHIRYIENIKIYWEKYAIQTCYSVFSLSSPRSHHNKLQ